jgi:penicillin-binding protein 1A
MQEAHKTTPRIDFAAPPVGLVRVPIEPQTGQRAPLGFEGAIEEVFLAGTEPAEPTELPSSGEPVFPGWPF